MKTLQHLDKCLVRLVGHYNLIWSLKSIPIILLLKLMNGWLEVPITFKVRVKNLKCSDRLVWFRYHKIWCQYRGTIIWNCWCPTVSYLHASFIQDSSRRTCRLEGHAIPSPTIRCCPDLVEPLLFNFGVSKNHIYS